MMFVAILGFGQSAEGEVPPMYNEAADGNAVAFTGAVAQESLLEQRIQEFNPITDFAVPLLVMATIAVGIDFLAMRFHYQSRGPIPNYKKWNRPSVKAQRKSLS